MDTNTQSTTDTSSTTDTTSSRYSREESTSNRDENCRSLDDAEREKALVNNKTKQKWKHKNKNKLPKWDKK